MIIVCRTIILSVVFTIYNLNVSTSRSSAVHFYNKSVRYFFKRQTLVVKRINDTIVVPNITISCISTLLCFISFRVHRTHRMNSVCWLLLWSGATIHHGARAPARVNPTGLVRSVQNGRTRKTHRRVYCQWRAQKFGVRYGIILMN